MGNSKYKYEISDYKFEYRTSGFLMAYIKFLLIIPGGLV